MQFHKRRGLFPNPFATGLTITPVDNGRWAVPYIRSDVAIRRFVSTYRAYLQTSPSHIQIWASGKLQQQEEEQEDEQEDECLLPSIETVKMMGTPDTTNIFNYE